MKRVFDIVFSLAALAALLPVFLAVAVAIKLDSAGPIFFSQIRIGKDGGRFRMYKFRKFRCDKGSGGPGVTVMGDSRFTRIGAVLAKLKLDELPQFWNVLVGDMSLVGPRPELPDFVARYRNEDRKVLSVRPGIFGINQMLFHDEAGMYPPDADPEEFYVKEIMPRKLSNDIAFLESATFPKEMAVLAKCIWRSLGSPFGRISEAKGR